MTNGGGCVWGGGAVNGTVLAECVSVSNDEVSGFFFVFEVLSELAYCGKRVKEVVFTDGGVPVYYDMRFEYGMISDGNVVTNNAVGTDADVFTDSSGI